MSESIKLVLTQSDIKQLVAEKYKLDNNKTTIVVYHNNGDACEPASTLIVVTGQRSDINN